MSLKVKWVKQAVTSIFFNTVSSEVLVPNLGQYLCQCNLQKEDAKFFTVQKSGFWLEVFKAWNEFNYKEPIESAEILNQVIWCNSYITAVADPGFPIGGAPTRWGGHRPPACTLFSKNVSENERN